MMRPYKKVFKMPTGLLAGIAAVTLTIASLLTACGAGGADQTKQNGNHEATAAVADHETEATGQAKTDQTVKIGVMQYVEHPSLDQAYQGFLQRLHEAGYKEGENLKIDFQNAQGEQANCQTIAGQFAVGGYDLILAIATPAAQAALNAIEKTPILVTAVTDLESTQLVDSNDKPGGNLSGTSDMAPIPEQIQLIKRMLPEAKTLGIIYSSGEANSEVQAVEAEQEAKKLGLAVKTVTISSTNEVQQVAESIMHEVDAVYLPSDNAIASSMMTVSNVAVGRKVPIFPAVEAMCAQGGLASISINYQELGAQTADMALRILEEGADPAEMPVERQKKPRLVINSEFAEEIGYQFSPELIAEAEEAKLD